MSEHEPAGRKAPHAPVEAKAESPSLGAPMEQALLAPHMRRPFLRRLAQRRASGARQPAAVAPEPQAGRELSQMYFFNDEEAGDIMVADGEQLPGGKTRQAQVGDMRNAERDATEHLHGVLIADGTAVEQGLSAFKGRVLAIVAEEKGGDVPGAPLLSAGLSALWKLIRAEIPFLALEIPGVGGAGALLGAAAGALPDQRPKMNIEKAAADLEQTARSEWRKVVTHNIESFVPRHRTQIHEAFVQAEAGKNGSGRAAVQALLTGLGVTPVGDSFAALLSGRLESALRDAIIAWKCRNDTLYGMARAASCAALPAHRDR